MWVVVVLAALVAVAGAESLDGWTGKAFPDIRGPAWTDCAPRHAEKFTLYTCDPDALLKDTQQILLNRRLNELANNTPCHCQRRSQCETDDSLGRRIYRGFVVSVALARNLELSVHDPSEAELERVASRFSRTLRGRWALGDCGNSALILIWEEYKQMYISTGRQTKDYLTDREVAVMRAQVQSFLNAGNYERALLILLEKIEAELMGEPELRVDAGTLSLIISVVVASILVCVITGCVCAFRCCGNLRADPETRVGRALERVESVKQLKGDQIVAEVCEELLRGLLSRRDSGTTLPPIPEADSAETSSSSPSSSGDDPETLAFVHCPVLHARPERERTHIEGCDPPRLPTPPLLLPLSKVHAHGACRRDHRRRQRATPPGILQGGGGRDEHGLTQSHLPP